MKKRTKIILSVCLAFHIVIGSGGYAYVSDYHHANETALEAMTYQTDGVLQIKQDRNVIWFVPEKPTIGLIFYPGSKVEHTAYAPLLRACAEQGIICALVQMPGNLAVLDVNAADGLQQDYPEITAWYPSPTAGGITLSFNESARDCVDFVSLFSLCFISFVLF